MAGRLYDQRKAHGCVSASFTLFIKPAIFWWKFIIPVGYHRNTDWVFTMYGEGPAQCRVVWGCVNTLQKLGQVFRTQQKNNCTWGRGERQTDRQTEKIRKDEIIMRVTIILGTENDPFCKSIRKCKCKREKRRRWRRDLEKRRDDGWVVWGLGFREAVSIDDDGMMGDSDVDVGGWCSRKSNCGSSWRALSCHINSWQQQRVHYWRTMAWFQAGQSGRKWERHTCNQILRFPWLVMRFCQSAKLMITCYKVCCCRAGLGWAACLLSAFCNNPKSKKKAKPPAPPGLPPKKIIMTNAKPKREWNSSGGSRNRRRRRNSLGGGPP